MSSSAAPRNHALWLAPALAIAGFLSYYAFFAQYPITRDHPWANLLILAAAIGLAVSGWRRAWPRRGWRTAAAGLGLFVSIGLTGLLIFYCYVLSYQLPSVEAVADSGERIPPIALVSTGGGTFDLSAPPGDKMILVFYRGFW